MLAFIHIPETVDGSFESILRRSFGVRHCSVLLPNTRRVNPVLSAEELQRTRRVYPWIRSIAGRAVVPYAELQVKFPDLRFYAFLREPIQRCASEFVRIANQMKFEDNLAAFQRWIRQADVRNRQCVQLCGLPDAETAIHRLRKSVEFVGLLERFHESLVMFARWSENPRMDVRYHLRKQAIESTLQRQLLSNLQTRRLLIEANREDARLYDEVFREIFPRQCESYGEQLDRDVRTFEAFNLPPSRFPGEILSLSLREIVYRPLSRLLMSRRNPKIHVAKSQSSTRQHRRAA